ncbi:MAG: hypothetical protein Q7T87_18495 [Polaromonas sp.]|nr:hypothetical protein [Polaromonas sp.]
MKEVLCGRTPAPVQCADLKSAIAFYTQSWGFAVQQVVPGVVAKLTRESVTVQLWQRRADMDLEASAYRLLVDDMAVWQDVSSAPGRAVSATTEQTWGLEFGISGIDGNRLLLVQSAPHRLMRRARA